MAATDCNICLETLTGAARNKTITCPKCQQQSCTKCIQTYMLNEITDPHCPNCRYGWTRRFIHENLSRSFLIGPWADHRRSVLWERDQSFLPEAQVRVERMKRAKELQKEVVPHLARRDALRAELETVNEIIVGYYANINRLSNGDALNFEKPDDESRKFIRKCMKTDCKGFLSTAWKCGICDHYTCRECLAIKGTERDVEHTCAAADLATAQLIAKDTKPCPKCGEGIYRSEGCSHMFCTSCKTAFNWNTMKIQEGGYIDNPHYFAYAQANGIGSRNPGELPCGGLPSYSSVEALLDWSRATLTNHGRHDTQEYKHAYDIRNQLGHIAGYIRDRYNAHNTDTDIMPMRVEYLMNELSKDAFKRQLLNLERQRERHRAIREVLDTYINVACDLFRNYEGRATEEIRALNPEYTPQRYGRRQWMDAKPASSKAILKVWQKAWNEVESEFIKIREYCNKALADVSSYYVCVVPQIGPDGATPTERFAKDSTIMPKKKMQNNNDNETVLEAEE